MIQRVKVHPLLLITTCDLRLVTAPLWSWLSPVNRGGLRHFILIQPRGWQKRQQKKAKVGVSQAVYRVMMQLTAPGEGTKGPVPNGMLHSCQDFLAHWRGGCSCQPWWSRQTPIGPRRYPGLSLQCKRDDLWKQIQASSPKAPSGSAQNRDWGEAHSRCSINTGKMHEGLSPSPWGSLLHAFPTSSTRRTT